MLKIAYDPIYAHPLPEGHRFPMLKYELIPGQLMHEGTISPENLFGPEPLPEEYVLLTHDAGYWSSLKALTLAAASQRRIGFPLTAELVEREIRIAQGTLDACRYSFDHGIAFNVAGGTHHAGTSWGEGFCLLNDQAMAANVLLKTGEAKNILVIDLDVHQGNGTAQIFENEPRVFTFSVHGEKNFPFKKERSDLDIPLADGTDDDTYLGLLHHHLPRLFERVKPDFVFYVAGVDVLATDKLGKFALSRGGCKERDRLVLEACKNRGIPLQVSMGGGYSEDIRHIVEAHCNTFRLAHEIFG
ncbi:histone deacetylase [Pedobacter sp. SYP-B3415]|uniref:histone deacetylase family protein n=1 Tax=Pedobacter sp. SYP-B3415 TaxID=2496641 RepID=UPI00101CE2DC|nr:histone deacetylase [Pedobacter sp. SYP-B3415]